MSLPYVSVYPCVYREHAGDVIICPRSPGLSLCVQGTWNMLEGSPELERFIPVCTGNIAYVFDTLIF